MEATGSMNAATREVFGNISPWMHAVFYGLMVASIGVLAVQVANRTRLWWLGRPGGFEKDWRLWVRRLVVFALAQKRVHRKSLGAALHVLLFCGFVILAIGTTLLTIAYWGPVNFYRGWFYLFYKLTMDVFGVALCAGCLLAMFRRMGWRPPALGHNARDWMLLTLLLVLGVSGFFVEALRLHCTQVSPGIARWSLVGHAMDLALFSNLGTSTALQLHLGFWWLHAALVSLFFVSIPVTRFLHVLTGPVNIATRSARPMGVLTPLKLEEVEKTGQIGVAKISDFNRQQLLSLDACMECGRCQEACPAWASGKPLSPMEVVSNLRGAMGRSGPSLHGVAISAETLWSCTMCQACVQECPVLIGQVDLISDLRRHLVAEGKIAGPPAKALVNTGRQFNPYGRPSNERLAWAAGLEVPTVVKNPNFDYLLWVGCAAAFDPRAQKVARSLVLLLNEAQVNFAVLGQEERCTGDSARRLGDEFLFQQLAGENIRTLNSHKVKKIVTPCPHCLNTLKDEYAEFGGYYEVQHHSQLLADLLRSKRLKGGHGESALPLTFHDPCYLARVQGELAAPREILQTAAGTSFREMPRHGKKTFCCGAGGGRMWFDEPQARRTSRFRADEVVSSGARTLATACPFCLNMMSDALVSEPNGQEVAVLDVAEIILKIQEISTSGCVK
jgi:Fe-S oxidoreductase